MTIAPHSGIVDFGTFTPPAGGKDGIQGEVPAPLTGQETYVLTATGWATGGGGGTVTAVTASSPLASSGGATPDISIASSTGSGSVVLATNPTLASYFDNTAISVPSYNEGRTWYDSSKHALAYYNDVSSAIVHVGQDIQVKVINNTGTTIPNGSPVYITSTSSGQTYPNIALAKADVASTSAVIGLTNGAIANGAVGYVTSQGGIDNVNTGTFTVGQVLYLSPYSAGQLMNTIPPTGITVQVGVVSYVNSSTGIIYVKQTTPLSVPASIITGILGPTYGGTGVNNGANTLTLGGNFTTSGAFTTTLTATANTSVTLPVSGTLISSVTNMAANPVTGTPSNTTYLRGDGTWATVTITNNASVGYTINGQGAVITTGVIGVGLQVKFACTITSVTLLADQTGSIVVDIWKAAYANYPPTVSNSIVASAPPTITSATKSTDSTLTGWTTSISAGDVLYFNVNSCSTITNCVLVLGVTKT